MAIKVTDRDINAVTVQYPRNNGLLRRSREKQLSPEAALEWANAQPPALIGAAAYVPAIKALVEKRYTVREASRRIEACSPYAAHTLSNAYYAQRVA